MKIANQTKILSGLFGMMDSVKMGVDTILTNDYFQIAQVVKKFKAEQ